jgi:hypothetical protein
LSLGKGERKREWGAGEGMGTSQCVGLRVLFDKQVPNPSEKGFEAIYH